jgi:hypothetical protein
MRVRILSDISWESKIDHALKVIDLRSLSDIQGVGSGLESVVVVLMCQAPELALKQRVRHAKEKATLYVDVMLDLPFFVQASHAERRAKIAMEVIAQLQVVLGKRTVADFNSVLFLDQLREELDSQLNGPDSARFDANCLERASSY